MHKLKNKIASFNQYNPYEDMDKLKDCAFSCQYKFVTLFMWLDQRFRYGIFSNHTTICDGIIKRFAVKNTTQLLREV